MAREFSEAENSRRAIDSRLLDVRTSMAGEVVSFDANTMTATVKPGVVVEGVDADTEQAEADEIGNIEGVPVQYPTFGSFIVYAPLSAGDVVRLEWSEQDDSKFYNDAGASVPVEPRILKRHGASLVCKPQGFRGDGALGSESAAKMLIGVADGTAIQIDDSGQEVKLGDTSASDFVALANLVNENFARIKSVFDAWVPVAAPTIENGAALKLAWDAEFLTPNDSFQDVDADKVKAT